MEYSYPLLSDTCVSHLAQSDTVEMKVFKIIGIIGSVIKLSLQNYYFHITNRSVVSVFCRLLSGLAPSAFSMFCSPFSPPNPRVSERYTRSASKPLLVKLTKSRLTAHLHSFGSFISLPWNQLPQSVQSFFPPVLHDNSSSLIHTCDFLFPH